MSRRRILAALGGAGWRNPYVTDGLVAMWDGEWNAGPGVHSDVNPGIWYNHGYGLTVATLSDTVIIGDKFISANTITNNILAVLTNAWEKCGQIESVLYRTSIPIIRGVWNRGYNLYINNEKFSSQRDHATEPYVDYDNNTINAVSAAYNNDGAFARVWKSGVEGTETRTLNLPSGSVLYKSQIGYSFSQDNKFFCARIYDRVLTDAEIAANYAIDKARFNLP